MNIVFMDSEIIDRGDVSWDGIRQLGAFQNYSGTDRAEAGARLAEAEAVFIDSFAMDREMIDLCPGLRFIGAAATGFNHIDIDYAREKGIAVCNVPAYSTEAVAQHAAALMLTIANRIGEYDRQVKAGKWNTEAGAAYEPVPLTLLYGRSLGIVGYGNIGRRTAEIARALGMTVNIYSRDPEAAVSSDVVSLHCPLTEENRGMVDRSFIERMKDGAILINTARGGLVDEAALIEALQSGKLSGAGLDVLDGEPPAPDSPILQAPNCIITPHIAFTPLEIRQRVVDVCAENLRQYLQGERLNRIV